MNVGFVKSFAALLMGTGFALAQSPKAPVSKMTSRGTMIAAQQRPDVSYPQSAGQQTYTEPLVSEANGNIGVVEGGFGGVVAGPYGDNPYTFYASADFLMWNIRNPSLPPLTTIVPVGIVRIQQPIFINGAQQANTPIFAIPFTLNNNPGLPNANDIDMGEHTGARLTAGIWFDADKDCGIEFSGFKLEKLSERFSSTTSNVTNQFNLDTGVTAQFFLQQALAEPVLASEAAVVIPAQGTSNTSGVITTEMWGAEVNLRSGGYRLGFMTFGGLLGVRYVNFEEQVTVSNSVAVTALPPIAPAQPDPSVGVLPASFQSFDNLRAQNHLFAPQVGLESEARGWGFYLNARAKVGVGPNFQEVEALGRQTSTTPTGGTLNRPGGLFSGPNNQGVYERTRVSVIPEVNFKLGYEITSGFRAYVGYDAIYMQNIVRPGQQVSFTNIQTQLQVANSNTTLGVRQPVIIMRDLDVWVQGINFGVELRY